MPIFRESRFSRLAGKAAAGHGGNRTTPRSTIRDLSQSPARQRSRLLHRTVALLEELKETWARPSPVGRQQSVTRAGVVWPRLCILSDFAAESAKTLLLDIPMDAANRIKKRGRYTFRHPNRVDCGNQPFNFPLNLVRISGAALADGRYVDWNRRRNSR